MSRGGSAGSLDTRSTDADETPHGVRSARHGLRSHLRKDRDAVGRCENRHEPERATGTGEDITRGGRARFIPVAVTRYTKWTFNCGVKHCLVDPAFTVPCWVALCQCLVWETEAQCFARDEGLAQPAESACGPGNEAPSRLTVGAFRSLVRTAQTVVPGGSLQPDAPSGLLRLPVSGEAPLG